MPHWISSNTSSAACVSQSSRRRRRNSAVAGVTPEAPDAAAALGGIPPRETITLTPADVKAALAGLSTAGETGRVDAVAICSPHLSLAEVDELEAEFARENG